MVKRRSKQSIREEALKGTALVEFRRRPRVVGVLFSHDDIEGRFALRVSHNEEPHAIHMCKDRDEAEFIKAWQRDVGLRHFEDALRQHKVEFTPWGMNRTTLDDYTSDYFDSYVSENCGDPGS